MNTLSISLVLTVQSKKATTEDETQSKSLPVGSYRNSGLCLTENPKWRMSDRFCEMLDQNGGLKGRMSFLSKKNHFHHWSKWRLSRNQVLLVLSLKNKIA